MNYRIVNGGISYGAETILEQINFEIKEKASKSVRQIIYVFLNF